MKDEGVRIGSGWAYLPEKDRYVFLKGEFEITADVIRQYMKDWRRPIENVHIVEVLNKFYRLQHGGSLSELNKFHPSMSVDSTAMGEDAPVVAFPKSKPGSVKRAREQRGRIGRVKEANE